VIGLMTLGGRGRDGPRPGRAARAALRRRDGRAVAGGRHGEDAARVRRV